MLLAAGAARAQDEADVIGLPIGARPEPAVIETLDGEALDLGEIVGSRPVLLQFWATWCENCKALVPLMLEAHRKFGGEVSFFAIAVGVGQYASEVEDHSAYRHRSIPQWGGC